MASELKYSPGVQLVYEPNARKGLPLRPCQPVYRVTHPMSGTRSVWVVGEGEKNRPGVMWVTFLGGPAPGAEPVFVVGRD
jgi:hypothetical protein